MAWAIKPKLKPNQKQSRLVADLMLVTLVLGDDWYQRKRAWLPGRTVGSKPEFRDSERLTLRLAIDFFEFTNERRFVAFVRANDLALFPKLLAWSQFNRRARSLRDWLNESRQDWAAELGVHFEQHFLLDTPPVIAAGYRRGKRHSDFRGTAEYAYCSARCLKYFGNKLPMLTTLDGTPYGVELVPANADERDAADGILGLHSNSRFDWELTAGSILAMVEAIRSCGTQRRLADERASFVVRRRFAGHGAG